MYPHWVFLSGPGIWINVRDEGFRGLGFRLVWDSLGLCKKGTLFLPRVMWAKEWRTMRSMVLRYGLVSFELTFMQNEGRDEVHGQV